MHLVLDELESPIGTLRVVWRARAVCAVDFEEGRMRNHLAARFGAVRLGSADGGRARVAPLRAYLRGDLAALDRLQIDPGGTPFQQRVWKALRGIPPGSTITYGALADRLGVPGGARAVGSANASNPIAVVVPCHRVIGADGSLTGYAGGVERKRWLLDHESRLRARPRPSTSGAAPALV